MEASAAPARLARLTTNIVTAYLEHNKPPSSELGSIIGTIAERVSTPSSRDRPRRPKSRPQPSQFAAPSSPTG